MNQDAQPCDTPVCDCVCHKVGILGFMCCPCSVTELRELARLRSATLPPLEHQIPSALQEIANACGGAIKEVSGPLSDGSGFAIMSMPLPKTHWIYADHENEPPARFSLRDDDTHIMFLMGKMPEDGSDAGFDSKKGITMTRRAFASLIRDAGKYAIRTSTMNGKDMDFDPDAMLRNLVMAFMG